MINLAKKIIKFYSELNQEPSLEDLEITDPGFTQEKWCLFVTLYQNWEIVWSCGNFIEIEDSKWNELIKACIWALNDERFKNVKKDYNNIKIRIDELESKEILKEKSIRDIVPAQSWLIVIKKDYEDIAILLPAISPNINTWSDLVLVLNKKLKQDFVENDYIIYEIKTKQLTDF